LCFKYLQMKSALLHLLFLLPVAGFAQYNWQPLVNAPKSFRCDDVYFLNPNLGWAIHPNYSYSTTTGGAIYKTTDGGETWQPLKTNSPYYLRSVGFADENTGWVGNLDATTVAPDTLIMTETTDGGLTWHAPNLPFPHPIGICGISVVNSNVTFAYGTFYGPAGYLKTTNKGGSWEYKDMSGYAGALVDGYFFNADTGFISGGTHDNKGLILSTYNGGTTWDTSYISTRPESDRIWKIFFTGGNIGYATLEYDGPETNFNTYFLKTTDRGHTWTEHPFVADYNEQGIGFINDSVGWIGGDYSKPNYITTNGGQTWSVDPTFGVLTPPFHDYSVGFLPGFSVNRFRKFGDTLLYASGKTIYKLNTKATETSTITASPALSLENHPNPLRDHTIISYTLPSSTTNLFFEIRDCMGVTVQKRNLGSQSKGKHSFLFTEPLPAGVYFYTIKSDSYSETKKMTISL
jgi:photosystem II stability/assembly factor-like uncharacterized protein